MQKLLELVAALFGLTRDDLVGRSRRRHVVEARQAAAWVLRRAYPALSLEAIGEILGDRDHTTIIYSLAQVEERMRADPGLAADLRALIPAPVAPATRRRPVAGAMRWWVAQGRGDWLVLAA
jgi:chromosomal replication initiator protein